MPSRFNVFYGATSSDEHRSSFITSANYDLTDTPDSDYDPSVDGVPTNANQWANALDYAWTGCKPNLYGDLRIVMENVIVDSTNTLLVTGSVDLTPIDTWGGNPDLGNTGMDGEYWGIGSKTDDNKNSLFTFRRVGGVNSGAPNRLFLPLGSSNSLYRLKQLALHFRGVERLAVSKLHSTGVNFIPLRPASLTLYHGVFNG